MGNWRTVQVTGTCAQEEVSALRKALDPGRNYENFHPLVRGGMAGLPNWASTQFNVTGNLAERGYGAESVAKTFTEKLLPVAPSLRCKVHVGDDYESKTCVATVTVADGVAKVGEPEVKEIGEISEAQMRDNLAAQLRRAF